MKTLKLLGFVLALALIGRILSGCGGSNPPLAATGQSDHATINLSLLASNLDTRTVSTSGAVEGFIYKTAQNVLTLGYSSTPSRARFAVAGAVISVVGAPTTTSDAQGHFLLSNIPAGSRRLSVVAGKSNAVLFPLTVIPSATIRVGSPPITRLQAVNKVKQTIPSTNPRFTFILATQQPLPTGATVSPALDTNDGVVNSSLVYRVPSPQWLVYVDSQTFLRFTHPVKYGFVDATTGALTLHNATSWPAINGVNFYGKHDLNFISPDLVQAPQGTAPPALDLASTANFSPASRTSKSSIAEANGEDDLEAYDHVAGCTKATTYALLIQGSDDSDQVADMKNIKQMFGHGGIPPAQVSQVNFSPRPSSPKADALAKFTKICQQATPCDTVFLYITSHGQPQGFAELEKNDKDGNPAIDDKLFPKEFDFSKCKACHIIVIIETCYSGTWINPLVTQFNSHPGLKYIIMTASVPGEESVAIPWYKPLVATGAVFTNELLKAFNEDVVGHYEGGTFKLLANACSVAQRRMDTETSILLPDQVSQQHPLCQGGLVPGLCGGMAPTGTPPGTIQTPTPPGTTHTPTPPGTTQTPTPLPTSTPKPPPTPRPTSTPAVTQTPTPLPTPVVTVASLQLHHAVGTHKIGEVIPLSRITGGRLSGPDTGCASAHLHGSIMIDGQGPFADPAPENCGFGPIFFPQ